MVTGGEWWGAAGDTGSVNSISGSGDKTIDVDKDAPIISANAQKQNFTLTTDGSDLRMGAADKYIFYNKASNSDKFSMFAKSNNSVTVEFYKIS